MDFWQDSPHAFQVQIGPWFGSQSQNSCTKDSVETEFFNGEVVRLAKKMGKEAPINDGLNRIIQEMAAKREVPGKYTMAELKKILGLT